VRIRTLLQLTAREYGLLLAALVVVLAVRLALWIVPSRVTLRFLGRISATASTRRATAATTVPPIVWAVEAASKFVPRASCLTQAIAAKLLLRRFGQDAQLCLGVVQPPDGTLRAHAWLEREGRPVLGGSGIQSMVRLPLLPDGAHIPASLTR
jgi:hypothetical protein